MLSVVTMYEIDFFVSTAEKLKFLQNTSLECSFNLESEQYWPTTAFFKFIAMEIHWTVLVTLLCTTMTRADDTRKLNSTGNELTFQNGKKFLQLSFRNLHLDCQHCVTWKKHFRKTKVSVT